jgi:hypothetical protein
MERETTAVAHSLVATTPDACSSFRAATSPPAMAEQVRAQPVKKVSAKLENGPCKIMPKHVPD